MTGTPAPPALLAEKTAVSTGECQSGRVTLKLSGVGEPASQRLPISLMIVFDRSGSMEGAPLAAAKEAADTLIDQLDSVLGDRIGFDHVRHNLVTRQRDDE